jgi:hypothetical protein
VTGAAFNPTDGLLYFTGDLGGTNTGGGGGNQQLQNLLFSVDPADPAGTLTIESRFTEPGGQSFAADSIGFTPDGNLFGTSGSNLFTSNGTQTNGIVPRPVNVVSGAGAAGTLSGIEFDPATNTFFAVNSGANASVLTILPNGNAISYGGTGANLSSLTFVPGLIDPQHRLDRRRVRRDRPDERQPLLRRPAQPPAGQNIWNITSPARTSMRRSRWASSATIADVIADPSALARPTQPYDASAGPFIVTNLTPPDATISVGPAGTGAC